MSLINHKLVNSTMLVSLNNIKTKNSMIVGFHDEIQSAIKEGIESTEVSSIIIYGEGNFFCAGGDLNSLKKEEIWQSQKD